MQEVLHTGLQRAFVWLGLKSHEVRVAGCGVGALSCVLASYFMLVPLRDEVGILLGTDTLPKLFMASLLVTFIAQPVASSLVSTTHLPRHAALRRFFRIVSAVIVAFALLFWLIRVPSSSAQPPEDSPRRHSRLLHGRADRGVHGGTSGEGALWRGSEWPAVSTVGERRGWAPRWLELGATLMYARERAADVNLLRWTDPADDAGRWVAARRESATQLSPRTRPAVAHGSGFRTPLPEVGGAPRGASRRSAACDDDNCGVRASNSQLRRGPVALGGGAMGEHNSDMSEAASSARLQRALRQAIDSASSGGRSDRPTAEAEARPRSLITASDASAAAAQLRGALRPGGHPSPLRPGAPKSPVRALPLDVELDNDSVDELPRVSTFSVKRGEATLSLPERALFVAFYLWMGVVNLLSTSLVWARCSELFRPEGAKRAFGVLAGGATGGQLVGSLTVQLLCSGATGQLSMALQLACLLISASLMWAVSEFAFRLQPIGAQERPKDVPEDPRPPRLALSRPSSRAHSIDAEHGPDRLSGPSERKSVPLDRGYASQQLSAAPPLLDVVRPPRAGSVQLDGKPGVAAPDGNGAIPRPAGASLYPRAKSGESTWRVKLLRLPFSATAKVRRSLGCLADAFVLIARSPLLLHLCGHLVCSYVLSSLLYFERSLVFASYISHSSARMRWMAAMHSCSALLILVLQVFATGRALRYGGTPLVLASVPLVCALGTGMLLVRTAPTTLVAVELARKLANYSFAKPAREMLFTAMSAEVQYKSKLALDTIVQRFGDSLGAAIFSALEWQYDISPRQLASICMICASGWFLVAYSLGRRYESMTS